MTPPPRRRPPAAGNWTPGGGFAVDGVDARDRRPVLVFAEVMQGEEGLLLGIRSSPIAFEQQAMAVRRVARQSGS